ncbi:MAG: hypothetical protein CMH62_02790 [Nanoarchaeota archaeon]|nr:hypothetical protein [Nanoarchaeota archaeon]|tara:strand:- start:1018 stop:1725 length:708 start_codon:yes stop_codon:yes gene_type:complete
METKQKNWGQIKGGLNSTGNTKEIKIPKKDEKLAEFIGIVLGDGNINSFKKGKKIRTYCVRIAGDSRHDRTYLTSYVKKLSSDLFNLEPRFHYSNGANCMYLSLYSLRLVEYFSEMKLLPGNKITNQTTIPKWIWKKDSYLAACVRGLYDTDGSVYELLPHWPGLFQVYFSNRNSTLLKDVRKALLKLGINISKISLQKGVTPRIYITKKSEIKKFKETIGFKNDRHLKKIKIVP